MKMLKSCTLALKKSLMTPSLPGLRDPQPHRRLSRTNTAPEASHPPRPPSPVVDHTQKNEELRCESEGKEEGGEENLRREKTSEEHGALVASQIFKSCTGKCPRHAFQATLATALIAATQGGAEPMLGSGCLTSKTLQDLSQLVKQVGLSWEVEQLAWWVVGSRQASVDNSWALFQLQQVQCCLMQGKYTEEETAELLHSFTLYIYSQLKRLRTLHTTFPDHPEDTTDSQLAYTLKCLRSLESHPASRRLLDQAGQPSIEEDVAAAVLRHSHEWWRKELKSCGNVNMDVESAAELLDSLPASFDKLNHRFHHVFQKEFSIPYAAISHQELTRQLVQLTKGLLVPTTPSAHEDQWEEEVEWPVLENFEMGSPLWCVYKSLGRLYSLREESACPPDYPGCFMGNVGTWLTHTHRHTLHRLHHPRPTHLISSHNQPRPESFTSPQNDPLYELLHAFKEAGRWWRELSWPEDETCGVVAVLLLQHLSSLAAALAHTLAQTSSRDPATPLFDTDTDTSTSSGNSTDSEESYTQRSPPRLAPTTYFDAKLCWSLAGVWRAGEAVCGLPEMLDVDGLVARLSQSGRNGAVEQLETTVSTLLASVTQNLNTLAEQVIGRAVDKIRPRLREEVKAACEGGGSSTTPPLLYLSLHNTLVCLQDHLHLPSTSATSSSYLSLASLSSLSKTLSSSSTSSKIRHSSSYPPKTSLSSTSPSKTLSNILSPFKISPFSSSSRSKTSSFYSTPCKSPPTASSNNTSSSSSSPSSSSTFYLPKTSPPSSKRSIPSSFKAPPSPQTPPSISFPSSSISYQSSSTYSSSSVSSHQRLLQQLWDALVVEFMVLAAESTGKRSAEYFSVVQDVLESVFSLLTSPGRLQPTAASTPGYRSVVDQVGQQRVSSVALISRYYQDRYRQQVTAALPTTAHVLIRAFFSQPAHLTVRVLEARDVAATGCGYGREYGRGHRSVRGSSRSIPRYHVAVQVVPSQVFTGASLCRTSASTHYPSIFDDTFEFPTGEGGVEGFLQLSLVVGSRGTGAVVGEAFLPLPAIPYLDSPTLQNTELPMTSPAFPPGYQALTALRSRMWDEQASSFVRQIERRHPQARPMPQSSSSDPR